MAKVAVAVEQETPLLLLLVFLMELVSLVLTSQAKLLLLPLLLLLLLQFATLNLALTVIPTFIPTAMGVIALMLVVPPNITTITITRELYGTVRM